MPQTRAQRAGSMVVIQPVRDWTCAECGDTDDLLQMHDAGPLCMACSDLDHLVFLPSGDTALTRRATKASSLSAVVVRWSRNRKRYERQGILVEEPALAVAEEQCMSDADARMRRRERDKVRREDVDSQFQARESGHRQPSLRTLAALVEAADYELVTEVRRRPHRLSRLSGPVGRRLRRRRQDVISAAAAHGVSGLRVFGSVARGEDRADSDVDCSWTCLST